MLLQPSQPMPLFCLDLTRGSGGEDHFCGSQRPNRSTVQFGDDHRGGGSYIIRQCRTHTREAVWFPGRVWAARDMTRGLVPSTRPTSLTLMRNTHWLMEGGWMDGDRSDYNLALEGDFLVCLLLFFLVYSDRFWVLTYFPHNNNQTQTQ